MPMQLLALTPTLWSDDVEGTLNFYTEVLGFECDNRNADSSWASLRRGTVSLMVARPPAGEPFDGPKLTGSLYFLVDDVDDAWQRLKDVAHVCYPIDDFDWGMREFGIFDNNGYLLQFGQELAAP
jgi:uncharacterized glyoxalase superfamily protein PhnB